MRAGRQPLTEPEKLPKASAPFSTRVVLKFCPYRLYGKGKFMRVPFGMFAEVPGTITAPLDWAME